MTTSRSWRSGGAPLGARASWPARTDGRRPTP